MKRIVLFFLFSLSLFASGYPALWRSSMIASIGTVYISNIVKADIAGLNIGKNENNILYSMEFLWHQKDIYTNNDISLKYYYKASYDFWDNINEYKDIATKINSLSFNPLFRFKYKFLHLDYSIGGTILSRDIDIENKGKTFAFNHLLSLGFSFYSLNVSGQFRHYSNNNIYDKNSGANFFAVNILYNY